MRERERERERERNMNYKVIHNDTQHDLGFECLMQF